MALKLINNAVGELASNINSIVTTINLVFGDGAKFPALAPGDWHPATIVKVDGTLEIVRVTARTGDAFTVQRGVEGTGAIAFSAGDRFELRLTAGALLEVFSAYALQGDLAALQTVVAGKQANLGYTPVQQGTGVGQNADLIKIGWNINVGRLSVTRNNADLGTVGLTSYDNSWTANQTFTTITTTGVATFKEMVSKDPVSNSYIDVYAFSGNAGLVMYTPGGLKVMRVTADNFLGFLNSAQNSIIASLSDAGLFSATGIAQTSDERLKKNWRSVGDGFVEKLSKLKHGIFDWITGGSSASVTAQGVQKMVPELVTEDQNGYLVIEGSSFAMLSAVKLAIEVEKLKERLNKLESSK